MSETDLELLKRYGCDHAEDAFAEIVRRHLNLVYSAALRQVRSLQLAEEVAQSAFLDPARNAAQLQPDTILTAWLYQVTRRTAIDVVRREARRRLREQVAFEMTTMNAPASDWAAIEPLLDEAMQALDDADRAAVLLRYFQNKSLREVGQALGTSDDAAQKRVSRAVERLREFFAQRGVTIGATGLAVTITANAVQAAPVSLAVTISTAAACAETGVASSATAAATKAITMTTLQKALVTVTIAAAVGAGIYEASRAAKARAELLKLEQQRAPLAELIQQLSRERDEAAAKLAALRDENERLSRNPAELLRLRGEIGVLRQELAERNRRIRQPDSESDDAARVWGMGEIKWRPEWKDLGLSSPEAAVQTYWCAVANTNAERIKQCMVFDRVTNAVPVSDLLAKRESRGNQGFYQHGTWAARLAAVTQDSPYRGRLQIEWMATDGPNRPPFDPAHPPQWNPDRIETLTVMRNDLEGNWKVVANENRLMLTLDDEDPEAVAKLLMEMPPEQFEQLKSQIPDRTLRVYEELTLKARHGK